MSDTIAPDSPPTEPIKKFGFGDNWSRFLSTVDKATIESAQESLRRLLGTESLEETTFLDAGSGSGLFSLAAHNLGATVRSFDADASSVACTDQLRQEYADQSPRWIVSDGSLLDSNFMDSLDKSDTVYCWGVAHHTGDMWTALENLTQKVTPGGLLVVAIYNDEQYISKAWYLIKQIYQRLPGPLKILYALTIWFVLVLRRVAFTAIACLLRLLTLRNPFTPILNWGGETRTRGMHGWYDLIDWIGGWPFEVAKPEEIFRFMRDRGFVLQEMTTSGGHGCNEFVFRLHSAE